MDLIKCIIYSTETGKSFVEFSVIGYKILLLEKVALSSHRAKNIRMSKEVKFEAGNAFVTIGLPLAMSSRRC